MNVIMTKPIALQLYSLREAAAQDILGVLKTTADLGYQGVEFAGYQGVSTTAIKDALAANNLTAVSAHVGYPLLQNSLDEVIADAQTLGLPYVVCPAAPRDQMTDAAAWKSFAKELTTIGQTLKAEGIAFGYHNHAFEFAKEDGEYFLDIFFQEADPNAVFAQLDLGWVMAGGENPITYMQKFAGRCPLVHVKDFDSSKKQTDVGEGNLDLDGVVKSLDPVGVQWMIIETEEYEVSPVASVTAGLNNLKAAVQRQA